MAKKEYILITVSGPDQPGITAKLMEIIAKNGNRVVDMGQSVTHRLLSLSILLDKGNENGPVLKDLLFEAKKMGLALDFEVIENGEDHQDNNGEAFILSCVSTQSLTADFIGQMAQALAVNNANIQRIDSTTKNFTCLEITTTIAQDADFNLIKSEILKISNHHKVDMAFLKDNVFRRSKRLIVFDMDSTLIQAEVIDEMAEVHGVGAEVKAITEEAMNGKIDFDTSLTKRVSKLKGLSVKDLEKISQNLLFTPGVPEFIKTVKSLGYKVAVISGGFSFFANELKQELGLDYAFANELEIKDGALTGRVTGTIINSHQKALLVDLLAQQESISLEQVVAIGDGANDLPMLAKAGLGIAFHAKDVVKKNAPQQLGHGPMTSILHFLGIPAQS